MSTLVMPKIDQSVLNDREKIVRDLKRFTNPINIVSDPEGIIPYETEIAIQSSAHGSASAIPC